jgi:hypothetical protein
MKPGIANSRIKKTNPTMNHKTAGLLKLCISLKVDYYIEHFKCNLL